MAAQIIPAILAHTVADFDRDFTKLYKHFSIIHIDIMDGTFVPHKSFDGIPPSLTSATEVRLELHLMVANPTDYIRRWEKVANVERVLIHVESKNVTGALSAARECGWHTGIVLNPSTPLADARNYFPLVDVVQFMTVQPGQQGAPLVPEVLEKIMAFKKMPDHPLCAVDGAVSPETIANIRDAGAERFVVGSALVKANDVASAFQSLVKA